MLARIDVSDIHSLASHDVAPTRASDVVEKIEKPAPLMDMLIDPVDAMFPHLCVLRNALTKPFRAILGCKMAPVPTWAIRSAP